MESNINMQAVNIIRHKKRTSAIINGLTAESVTTAIVKIDFTNSKNRLIDVPLYCRPLRDMTPEKPPTPENNTHSKETGTKPKLPGLPQQAKIKQHTSPDLKVTSKRSSNVLNSPDGPTNVELKKNKMGQSSPPPEK